MDFYDMDGRPIDLLTWARKFEDFESRILAEDSIDNGVTVRTVWVGYCEPALDTDIFGTAIINGDVATQQVRHYHTRAEALAGHRSVVAEWKAPHGPRC